MKRTWWKEATAYQIYPRSFMDANGDGIGDLQGVISKLDYLQDFGIDVIWICPIFESPNADNGYDISDYQDIMKDFGSMEDFDELLAETHKRGMKLIMDLVVNHTSDEHPWFIESRTSKNSEKRDWYIWRDGKDGKEPNNWESIFNGSAWEKDELTDQYYLHVFAKKQPDLNWDNTDMREAVYKMINWWLDKGIDGFRVDAISHIKKKENFPDLPNPYGFPFVPSFDYHMNVDGILTHLTELKAQTFARYDIMTVGEANGVRLEQAEDWVGEKDGIFNMIFQFEHLGLWDTGVSGSIDLAEFKKTMTKWQKGLEGRGWNALFLENHDQPRSVSTWGNDTIYLNESAKALAAMYFFMQGTPFIYQGQEIGMKNVHFDSIVDYDDVAMKNLYLIETAKGRPHEEIMEIIWHKGRDNSRTPMQWNKEKNGGFSNGTPWFGANLNYVKCNVEEQMSDPESIYHFYKKMINLRKENDVLIYGSYDCILDEDKQIYAYTRTLDDQKALIICNISGQKAYYQYSSLPLSSEKLMLANYKTQSHKHTTAFMMKPYEARVYLLQ
ncbi:alpha-glucosidase [Metabacillus sp. GX 13764]|uniref:glycoside hydrolase family 13 protein n=1 Tax=Metabacillus kandeliae TaxID=2900151 RepID=UPI001E445D1C|nr:alpha-glucosidase [Metabacillus kandeliae]MCD7035770.1 alpha-glucosidase [Metabacillus kandeliae]